MKKKKAIFLDRDGTLNEDAGYVHKIEDYKLLPGVLEGLTLLKEKGYIFFIITNQSGIGRGYYTIADFIMFNGCLISDLANNGITIEKSYYCPHIPEDNCKCRKPKTINIEKATKEYKIDISNSWMIGDHPSDVQLGINAGCKTIYLCTGDGTQHFSELKEKDIEPTFIAKDFLTATNKIIELS